MSRGLSLGYGTEAGISVHQSIAIPILSITGGGGSKGNFGELWESPPGFLKFPKKKFPKIPQNSPKFPKKIPQNSTLSQSLFLIGSIILYILLYSQ